MGYSITHIQRKKVILAGGYGTPTWDNHVNKCSLATVFEGILDANEDGEMKILLILSKYFLDLESESCCEIIPCVKYVKMSIKTAPKVDFVSPQ